MPDPRPEQPLDQPSPRHQVLPCKPAAGDEDGLSVRRRPLRLSTASPGRVRGRCSIRPRRSVTAAWGGDTKRPDWICSSRPPARCKASRYPHLLRTRASHSQRTPVASPRPPKRLAAVGRVWPNVGQRRGRWASSSWRTRSRERGCNTAAPRTAAAWRSMLYILIIVLGFTRWFLHCFHLSGKSSNFDTEYLFQWASVQFCRSKDQVGSQAGVPE